MAVALATTSMPNPKRLIVNSHQNLIPNERTIRVILPLPPHQNPHRTLTMSKSSPCIGPAIASIVFSTIASDRAMAAQKLAEVPEGDNRIQAILLPLIPAILWVLYNILGPALNQINRMRSEKAILVGLGLGGSAALSFLEVPDASASESAVIGEVPSDNTSLLVSVAVTLALLWVYYNILEPALNQNNKMRSS